MLLTHTKKQGTLLEAVTPTIERWVAAFLVARCAEGKRESKLTFTANEYGLSLTGPDCKQQQNTAPPDTGGSVRQGGKEIIQDVAVLLHLHKRYTQSQKRRRPSCV